jgi:plasmid stabilization system protein ParE
LKHHPVIIPPFVQQQIEEQVEYIAADSIENALAWEERLRGAIKRIGELPRRYAIDGEMSARYGTLVHKVVFERTYLVFYCIDKNARSVHVLNFRHGARKSPSDGE